MAESTSEVTFDKIHGIINKLKYFIPECSSLDLKKLFRLGEKDEEKLEIFVLLSEFIPLLVDFQNRQMIIKDIINGISNLVSNFDPLTPPTYVNECLNVFKSVWNILDPKEKSEFVLKSQYMEVITLKFCQFINLFFIPRKSLLWTLQQVQCFKTVLNELCNILIMVSDADCGLANDIIICAIKKICNLLKICVSGRLILNGWNFNSYVSTVLVCLEVLLGNSPAAQHYFVSYNGIYLILKWIDFLIKEQCYASKEILDLIGKIACVAVRENKYSVQHAIDRNAIQILIKFLEKYKQKVIVGVVPAIFFLTADSEDGLEMFHKADGLSVIKNLENANNLKNTYEALTVLRQVIEGQSDYSNSAVQIVESSSLPSSLPRDPEKNVNNADVNNLELKNKNLLMITSDTNQQSDLLKVNNTSDKNMFNEDVYSSDDDLYTSAEEVLSSSST